VLAIHSLSSGPRFLGPRFYVHPSPLPVHRVWTPGLPSSLLSTVSTLNTCTSQANRHIAHTTHAMVSLKHTKPKLRSLLTTTHDSHMGTYAPCVCSMHLWCYQSKYTNRLQARGEGVHVIKKTATSRERLRSRHYSLRRLQAHATRKVAFVSLSPNHMRSFVASIYCLQSTHISLPIIPVSLALVCSWLPVELLSLLSWTLVHFLVIIKSAIF
jgi:hypothetical protein